MRTSAHVKPHLTSATAPIWQGSVGNWLFTPWKCEDSWMCRCHGLGTLPFLTEIYQTSSDCLEVPAQQKIRYCSIILFQRKMKSNLTLFTRTWSVYKHFSLLYYFNPVQITTRNADLFLPNIIVFCKPLSCYWPWLMLASGAHRGSSFEWQLGLLVAFHLEKKYKETEKLCMKCTLQSEKNPLIYGYCLEWKQTNWEKASYREVLCL